VAANDVPVVRGGVPPALDSARAGEGPVFVEALTYRMAAHTTSDDASRYRPAAEEEEWAERDPILRLRRHLEQLGEIDEAFTARCDEEAHDLAMQLHHHIHGMEDPDPVHMFDHPYAEPHPIVDAEREEYLAYVAQFEDDGEETDR
jgi:pyruvate dehydrogenase E1 component alpha subunit